MTIKFLCPNGHQLSAPENLAGKPGKCPKCNTPFVVPTPEEEEEEEERSPPAPVAAAETSSANSAAKDAGASGPKIGEGSGKGTLDPSKIFIFLCPNGHKLNGPPSLKGKAGQCPHCGAKFRIPADDDNLELPEEPATDAANEQQFVFPGFETDPGEEVYEAVEVEDTVDPPPEGLHALGYILGRLWDRKGDDTELEIFLNEGEIISPEYFAEILSCREYGVFASQEGDGSYSLTVIPWATVRKVGLRKVPEISERVFR